MNHDNLMLLPKQSRISTDVQTQSFHTHIIKVWEDIGEPMDWADELDLINSSSENDTIVLDICSDGGYLDTAMLFNRALRSTAAHTVAIIGPSAASAASVFALSCKEWVLDETSSLMAHTSSYKIGGKDTDILEHANFSRKQLRNLYESVYTGFLSDDEIEDVIKGTPFYFDAQQLADRLDRLTEYRESLPQGCNDPSCTDCSEPEELQSRTLEEIIKEAVAEALESKFPSVVKASPEKKAPARKKAVKKTVDKPSEEV